MVIDYKNSFIFRHRVPVNENGKYHGLYRY